AMRAASGFFGWCFRQGLIEKDPTLGLERLKPRKRTRVLSAAEIKAVWGATGSGSDYDQIVRLLLLTGCRLKEIGALRWSEVSDNYITLPPPRTKNAELHELPLTPTMHQILDPRERRPGNDFVFGRADNRPFSGWSEAKTALDRRIADAGVVMPHWTHH